MYYTTPEGSDAATAAEQSATRPDVTLIDESDMPSSSRSMSLLVDEALAAIDKYPESSSE